MDFSNKKVIVCFKILEITKIPFHEMKNVKVRSKPFAGYCIFFSNIRRYIETYLITVTCLKILKKGKFGGSYRFL